MGAADRRAYLQEVAELLAYARTPQFQNRIVHILEAVRVKLEEVKDDVEESAENLEEHFPDRADELRDEWEWVEEAYNEAEEAVDEVTKETPTPERIGELADGIENEIVEAQVPRKRIPPLDTLLRDIKPSAERKVVLPLHDLGKKVFGQLRTPEQRTFDYIKLSYQRGLLTLEEHLAVLSFIALGTTDLGEFDRFFGHETTEADINELWKEAQYAFTPEWADKWKRTIAESREIRRTLGITQEKKPYRPSPWEKR